MGEGKTGEEKCRDRVDEEGKMGEGKHSGFDDDRIAVVENENRREGAITDYPKEVSQVVKDLCTYFERIPDLRLAGAAPDDDLRSIQPCPEILLQLLEVHNGGWFIYDYRVFSAAEAASNKRRMQASGLTPFAENIDGDLLVAGDDEGRVYSFESLSDMPEASTVEDECLASYLEKYRNRLLSNQLVYLEECGMVEKD